MSRGPTTSTDPVGSDAQYVQRFVSDLPDAAVAVLADGTIMAANELVHELLGFPPGTLVGATVEALVPTRVRAQHRAWRETFQHDPSPRPMGGGMILDARRADGTDLHVEISLAPLVGTTVAIIRDRSETVRTRQALRQRLEVEMAAVAISSRLTGASGENLDRELDEALGHVCRLVDADQALLYATSDDGTSLELTNEWCVDGLDPDEGRVERLPRQPFGWARPRLEAGQPVDVPSVDALPAEASQEAAFMLRHGILSALTIPIGVREEYEGSLALRWRTHLSTWDPERTDLLHLIGNVFLAAHRRRQAEAFRDATELRQRRLLDTLGAGVVLIRRSDGSIVSANPAAAQIVGVDLDELVGIDVLSSEIELIDERGQPLTLAQRNQLMDANHHGVTRDLGIRHGDGGAVWVEVRAVGLTIHDEDHLAVSFIDVTDRREAEALLVSRALHDPLTGLANRLLFGEHARTALARAERNGTTVAFVFFDLDHFKRVNDNHGHAAGDALLSSVARRVDAALRSIDVLARIGGDEFVAVLSDLSEAREAEVLADRIQEAVRQPVTVEGTEHRLSASIGVAAVTAAEAAMVSVDELLRRADRAMYAAKHAGRDRSVVWDESLVASAHHRQDLETELHQGLLTGEFRLYFQPIIDIDEARIAGGEALLRWEHPRRGLLHPAQFLDVAEDCGLIVPLGQWALEEACATAAGWPDDVWVSVNLSARQIGGHDAAARVRDALQRTGVRPDRLHLELTESALIEGSHSVLSDLDAIRNLGAVIGLDDFGTGYASMTYLHTLPLSFLKVDRSFVSELDHTDGHRATTIVDMVLRLSERFELDVIAEGVENDAQLSRLRTLGCRYVQGFLYDHPLAPADFTARLRTRLGEGPPQR